MKKTILKGTKDLHLPFLLHCCFYSPNYHHSTFAYFFHLFCYLTLNSKEIQKSLIYSWFFFSLVYPLKWKTPLDPWDINLSSLIKHGKMKRNLHRSFQRSTWKNTMKFPGGAWGGGTCQGICLLPLITSSQWLMLHCLRLVFTKNNCEESLFYLNIKSLRNNHWPQEMVKNAYVLVLILGLQAKKKTYC